MTSVVFGPTSSVGGGGGSSRCGGTALREPQGDRNHESPLRRGAGEWGMRWGLVVGMPRSAPLWIPAFAGTTMGGVRAGECCWWRRGKFPLRRDGRFANRPYDGVRGSRGYGGVGGGVAPLSAPLDTGFRRYDDGGCSGRQVLWVADAEVPASAGTTKRAGDTTRDGGTPAPRPCPGFPLSREGRWGRGLLRVPSGQASTGSGRTDWG